MVPKSPRNKSKVHLWSYLVCKMLQIPSTSCSHTYPQYRQVAARFAIFWASSQEARVAWCAGNFQVFVSDASKSIHFKIAIMPDFQCPERHCATSAFSHSKKASDQICTLVTLVHIAAHRCAMLCPELQLFCFIPTLFIFRQVCTDTFHSS